MNPLERTRIGIITPDDAVNDDEYWRYVNPDVTLLLDRFRTPERDAPINPGMVASYGDTCLVGDAAETLRITRPHALVFFCNSCSFVRGRAGNQELCSRMQEAGQAPATTISLAQIEALRALRARRVAVGAPYTEEVTSHLHRFLGEYSIEVVFSRSLGMKSEWEIGNSHPDVWRQLAADINHPGADALLLACSGIRTADVMETIEHDHQKPLVSAPAAGIWHALKLAGYRQPVLGRGTLLANHLSET